MWKAINNIEAIECIENGHLICENEFSSEHFKVIEVKDNGIIKAENVLYADYIVIFLKSYLLGAGWFREE